MKYFSKNGLPNMFPPAQIFSKEFFLTLVFIIFVVVYPSVANAGFFSFVSNFAPNQVSADTTTTATDTTDIQNSQNMLLLSPALNPNPDPNNSNATSDVPISDNAIIPEAVPILSGTSSDAYLNTQINTYVVRPGDTLSEIAKIFGVSVNTIIWANDLSSSPVLSVGQTLIILPISGINYVFKKGDTLQSVVKRYNADLNEVLQYNDITLDSTINVGDTIIIPDAELGSPQFSANSPSNGSTQKIKPWSGKGIPPRSLWGVTGENPAHDTNGPDLGNYFIRPIDHGMVSQGLHGYNAVDLAAPVGTPIHASAGGTVIISKIGGWNGGYGNYIVISHPNGTQTLYAHTSKNLVTVGEEVDQGDTIGLVGKTGEATGPHVHFEIRGAKNPFVTPIYF